MLCFEMSHIHDNANISTEIRLTQGTVNVCFIRFYLKSSTEIFREAYHSLSHGVEHKRKECRDTISVYVVN